MKYYQRIKPKPTKVYGVQFRSKLEAKWARYFTKLKLRWEYIDVRGADFLVDVGNAQVFIEVKPYLVEDLTNQMNFARSCKTPYFLVAGPPRYYELYRIVCLLDGQVHFIPYGHELGVWGKERKTVGTCLACHCTLEQGSFCAVDRGHVVLGKGFTMEPRFGDYEQYASEDPHVRVGEVVWYRPQCPMLYQEGDELNPKPVLAVVKEYYLNGRPYLELVDKPPGVRAPSKAIPFSAHPQPGTWTWGPDRDASGKPRQK